MNARQLLSLAVLLTVTATATAGDPVVFLRPNPYDVWQVYAVDRSGRFRPRVVESADGLRYAYNGEPFVWPLNYPQHVGRGGGNVANFAGQATLWDVKK